MLSACAAARAYAGAIGIAGVAASCVVLLAAAVLRCRGWRPALVDRCTRAAGRARAAARSVSAARWPLRHERTGLRRCRPIFTEVSRASSRAVPARHPPVAVPRPRHTEPASLRCSCAARLARRTARWRGRPLPARARLRDAGRCIVASRSISASPRARGWIASWRAKPPFSVGDPSPGVVIVLPLTLRGSAGAHRHARAAEPRQPARRGASHPGSLFLRPAGAELAAGSPGRAARPFAVIAGTRARAP